MKYFKLFFILFITVSLVSWVSGESKKEEMTNGTETTTEQPEVLIAEQAEEEEAEPLTIPPEAHQKAIQAVKDLGPGRGALKIDYHMVAIVGITSALKAESIAVQAALKDLGAKVSETEVQIELPGDVLFDFDKWNIRPDAEESMKKVGDIIKAYKNPQVIISGHTDSKGSGEYNLGLSQKRANSVKNWLVEKAGIEPDIMKTIGSGESKPVAANTNPDGTDNLEGRQKNRRVEIVIKKG